MPSPSPPSAEEWAKYRHYITSLYLERGLPLREVVQTMRQEYQFVATERMYKARLKKWNVVKNVSTQAVTDLVRQHVQEGRRSQASLDGAVVDDKERMQSYMKQLAAARRKYYNGQAQSAWWASAGDPLLNIKVAEPLHFGVPHDCLRIMRKYMDGAQDKDLWKAVTVREDPHCGTWMRLFYFAGHLVNNGRVKQGFRMLNLCHDQYKARAVRQHPDLLIETYRSAFNLALYSPALAFRFISYVCGMTSIALGPGHPLTQFWTRFVDAGPNGLEKHIIFVTVNYVEMLAGSKPEWQGYIFQSAGSLAMSGVMSPGNFEKYLAWTSVPDHVDAAREGALQVGQVQGESARWLAMGLIGANMIDAAAQIVSGFGDYIKNNPDEADLFQKADYHFLQSKIYERQGDEKAATDEIDGFAETCTALLKEKPWMSLDELMVIDSYQRLSKNQADAPSACDQIDKQIDILYAVAKKGQTI